LQKLNANTKLQKLKRRRNTKTIARENINTKLQKLKESRNTRIYRSERQNITPKKFAETERKYQIAETEEKMKYQNNCRDRT
jgi:hypothetical protein